MIEFDEKVSQQILTTLDYYNYLIEENRLEEIPQEMLRLYFISEKYKI